MVRALFVLSFDYTFVGFSRIKKRENFLKRQKRKRKKLNRIVCACVFVSRNEFQVDFQLKKINI